MYDPTRLAALVAVAEAGSITRAAERLGYTPPALSQQVAKLEREAGATLLVRSHRGTRLTDAGELLVVRARRVLDEMELARHELAGLTGLSGGTLRLGTFQTAGTHLLPPVLSAFRRAHPDVALAVADYEPRSGSRRSRQARWTWPSRTPTGPPRRCRCRRPWASSRSSSRNWCW